MKAKVIWIDFNRTYLKSIIEDSCCLIFRCEDFYHFQKKLASNNKNHEKRKIESNKLLCEINEFIHTHLKDSGEYYLVKDLEYKSIQRAHACLLFIRSQHEFLLSLSKKTQIDIIGIINE